MEGTREAQDDAYWRLISIETPLLHTRRCRTDDLPDVIPCLRRSLQHYVKRTAASAIYWTWMLTTRVGCISCIRASKRRLTAAIRKSGASTWKILICEGTQELVAFNPLNPELNPICYLLALLGAHHFLHVSRIRVKLLTLRRLMSYIYMKHQFLMFLDHTQRLSTVGRTPLDE